MTILFAPYFRTIAEIFSESDYAALHKLGTVLWDSDKPLLRNELRNLLPETEVFIGTNHDLSKEHLAIAKKLSLVIDVSGGVPATIDYAACKKNSISLYSCSPCFAPSVGEMALAMVLSSLRGLTREHVQFRSAQESWQADDPFDANLRHQTIGLIGFGATVQSFLSLLAPFNCSIQVFDPWVSQKHIQSAGYTPLDSLEELMHSSRIVLVFAAPTSENHHLLNESTLSHMQQNALLVLISRAHLCDFNALTQLLYAKKIAAAIDVFPDEPFDPNHPIRNAPNVILSAHRACAVLRDRQRIGKAIVADLPLIRANQRAQHLKKIDYTMVDRLLVKTPSTSDPEAS